MGGQAVFSAGRVAGERSLRLPRLVFVLIGFTAIIAQIVLMRELVVVFYGNEISVGLILANWLFWTAVGSGLLGRFVRRAQNARRLMAALQALIVVVLPATILGLRASRYAFQPTPGELLGPGAMLLTSFLVLSVFCTASGLLFAAGSRAYACEAGATPGDATSSVYLLEAVGSGVGGLLASLLLIRTLDAFQITLLLSLFNLLAAAYLAWPAGRRGWWAMAALLALGAGIGIPPLSRSMGRASLRWLWRGFEVVTTRNSVYGNLALVQTEGARSLYENGLVISTAPDAAAAEEAVHYALLGHPAPASLLVIGGGVNGSVAQTLQYRSLKRVDYVELDPTILELARSYFRREWAAISTDPRLHIHHTDGRLFLRTTPEKFDVIIVNLPDPQTAQLNRFYTLEFFREAAARLAPGGVFSFQLRAAEDYISPELADFLRCIRKTLGEVFPEITFIPGSTVHFFGALRPGVLATGPAELLERLRARQLHTRYVREYYIPFRMTPDRMLDFDLQTRPRAGTPVNRDFAPIAYYFDVALWSERFNPGFRRLFQSVAEVRFAWLAAGAGLLAILLAAMLGRQRQPERRLRATAGLAVAATGFTLMELELLLLLGFQAIYGYVYHQLAIVIAFFMVGMAIGSWRAVRRRADSNSEGGRRDERLTLGWLQVTVGLAPLLMYGLFVAFKQVEGARQLFVVSQIIFPALALLCGLVGGYQFPVASRVFFGGFRQQKHGPGALYAFDLAGACVGAVVLSTYLLPVFGLFKTALLSAVVNLAPASLALAPLAGQRIDPARRARAEAGQRRQP